MVNRVQTSGGEPNDPATNSQPNPNDPQNNPDNNNNNTNGAPDNSEEQLLAGKYKTPEELEKAYKELEAKLGNNNQQSLQSEPDNQNKQTPQADPNSNNNANDNNTNNNNQPDQPPDPNAAQEHLEQKGLDFNKYQQEYVQNGQLSNDSLQELNKAGISQDVVDNFIAGRQAVAEKVQSEVFQTVGGQENFQQVAQWARDNMSQEEITAYNNAVNSEDVAATKLALQGIYSKYVAANGQPPQKVYSGETTSPSTGYQSWNEVTTDMNSDKYRNDPAFREQVQKKLAASKDLL